MQLTQQLLENDWNVAMHEQSDTCDFTTADEMGKIDALLGMPCQPLEYFCKLGDVELYIIAWKDTNAALPPLPVDVVSELEAYQDDVADRSFWAQGGW